MNHSILVTGGAGYLGSILVPELLAAGHRVTVLDNFLFRQNSLAHCCADPNFELVRGDCRDESLIGRLLEDADVVIPLAALVGAPLCKLDPVGATSTNLDAQLMLLRRLSPDQRVLMPITNSGYGIGEKDRFCTEETPLRPVSLYGIHKVEVEKALLDRGNAISFRLATVFGMSPRMRLDLLVNDFVYRACTDRSIVLFESGFKRNYIHIRDVAMTFLFGLENFDRMKDQPYNVGLSDANLSKRELCTVIARHVPELVVFEAPIGEDPDKRDYIVSNEKLERTGWRPRHDLDRGIVELLKGYRMIRNSVYGNV
ncbi:Nucleoside-diphosphate-sugar epimerase [Tistlia consotensis]|uniref:Nucleoside-diphosphate-sugar epimerase n=1 Tax=Tistlia consotensis USBA 355 TaxID=560819 RepID=A0A1Y6CRW2_9PROT|nr:SDR family oxidoreductase [Tistlia consotensis]SMF71518.1 Nucleoside-diphosphate-sugar epimerase [Tistlia consotensis USBA 355]SNS06514.1 Nucleoside-diphosphate-sugar epimerase [Tistlia consotensis]